MSPNEPDYPHGDFGAAHSMDTTWWAVDLDDNVGMFSTNEAGALPVVAVIGGYPLHINDLVDVSADPRPTELCLSGFGNPPNHLWVLGQHTNGRDYGGLAVVADPQHLRAFGHASINLQNPVTSPGGRAVIPVAPVGERQGLYAGWLPAELLQVLHDKGQCLGCTSEGGYLPEVELISGIYVYDHLAENWTSGPYGRRWQPRGQPRRRSDPGLEGYNWLRLPIHFSTTEYFNPVEHVECNSWEGTFLPVGYDRPLAMAASPNYRALRQLYPDLAVEVRPYRAGRDGVLTELEVRQQLDQLEAQPYPLPPPLGPCTATAVARGIRQSRSYDELPILADALEEAGISDPEILGHCRRPEPHSHDCWVLAWLLDGVTVGHVYVSGS